MQLWIVLSISAAFFQSLRFVLQKQLSQVKLTATGATLARFLYSAPIVVLLSVIYFGQAEGGFPLLSTSFWFHGAIGGVAQVLATICTVKTFAYRNFAVGVTFKKTEVMQAAVIGLILFAESVSLTGFVAIVLGFFGVLVLSSSVSGAGSLRENSKSPATVLGLSAGALFGVSAVSYRAASLSVGLDDPFERALITLAAVTSMQLLGMLCWLAVRDFKEILRVLAQWRTASLVGITSIAGSFCWFAAFSLQNAAYVKAVGQVELIFSLIASTLVFREKITKRELMGIALISLSVLALVLVV